MQRLRTLHLFAGAGGGILADLLLRHQPVCAVEIDEYCQQVLSARQADGTFPWFPIFADVTKFDGRPWRGAVDLVSGGFPCQAFSTAARGRNTAADLWPEMARVVREVQPAYVFAENVTRSAIERAAVDCAAMGYKAEMLTLGAADLGADHVRERHWLLAYADDKSELRSHIDAKVAECAEFREGVWQAMPWRTGMDDGVAGRMERYEATGNGQVSIVAAAALWALAHADC